MGRITRTCSALALAVALGLLPSAALADTSGLSAYLKARAADAGGDSAAAAADYARALAARPDPLVAIRAFREALVAGDLQLAERSIAVLDRAGVAPDDAPLLALARAAQSGDRPAFDAALGKLSASRLVILTPSLRAWGAWSRRKDWKAALDAAADPVARRLASETRALLLIATGKEADGVAAVRALGSGATLDLRIAAVQLLAGRREDKLARALAGDDAPLMDAITITGGQKASVGFGVSWLLTRVLNDLLGGDPNPLSLTLGRAALIADPGNDRARLLLANALLKQGASAQAIALLDQIGPDHPFGPAAAAGRVTVLAEARRSGEALAAARVLAQAPGAGRNEWQLYADRLLEADRPADAVPYLQRIAEGSGASEWVVWLQLGGALEQAGRWPEARAALGKAVALGPDEPVALNYLGYARVVRGEDPAEARRQLEAAHRLAPADASIADSLAWAYHLTGDTRRALPLLEDAARKLPANAEVGEHLGDVYWALGRRYEARYAWTAAALVADAGDAARLQTKVASGPTPANAPPVAR